MHLRRVTVEIDRLVQAEAAVGERLSDSPDVRALRGRAGTVLCQTARARCDGKEGPGSHFRPAPSKAHGGRADVQPPRLAIRPARMQCFGPDI